MNPNLAVTLGLLAALLAPAPARAERVSHDAVRAAVERGEIRPLAEILERVGPQLPGEIVGTELEHERERWIYEFRVLGADGRLHEAHVDAATGALLELEEK